MGEPQRAGKSYLNVASNQVNSAFHPSGVGKSSSSLSCWG